MSTVSRDSSTDFGLEPYMIRESGASAADDGAAVWLDGDVLACACPDCGAPMSIRLWLMLADCFRCGATIELSEEQEQEALRLLRERETKRREETEAAAAAISPTIATGPRRPTREVRKPEPRIQRPAPPVPETAARLSRPATDADRSNRAAPRSPERHSGAWSEPVGAGVGARSPAARSTPQAKTEPPGGPLPEPGPAASPKPAGPDGRPVRRRVAASEAHRGARARVRELYQRGGLAVWLADLLRELPAWLVSLVFHLVLLLLLSLIMVGPQEEAIELTLSTSVSHEDFEGEDGKLNPEAQPIDFEDPGAIELLHSIDELGAADEPVPKLEPVDVAVGLHASIDVIPNTVARDVVPMPRAQVGHMFTGRNPEARSHLVRSSGGTSQTEAAVTRGLEWLAKRQNADGSWSLHAFHKSPGAGGKGSGMGSERSLTAGTALALLPFLGAGQTHLEGKYTEQVFGGLKWLIEQQHPSGDLRGGGSGRMYAHGQCAIVLCEAFALTRDDQLREPAQRALNFIVAAQHGAGGWRYQPGEPGDTSVVGWQLMALQSGRMGYLHVPTRTLNLASKFLDSVQRDSTGGRYAYMPGRPATHVMTAEALLCRQYLGWPKDHPGLDAGARFLLEEYPPEKDDPHIYYWYYATQVMHHLGGDVWRRWNAKIRRALCETQETTGHEAGSWAPRGGFASRGGRLYMTSLALCTLEVYYRHMPLYAENLIEQTETLVERAKEEEEEEGLLNLGE